MSVGFTVSNIWDTKFKLVRPMGSHVVVPAIMVPVYFFFCCTNLCISVWVISTE